MQPPPRHGEALPLEGALEDDARAQQQLPREEEPDAPARARLEIGPEGAVVMIDPRTRDVLALVGGYEEGPGFDRATNAIRQPGSPSEGSR